MAHKHHETIAAYLNGETIQYQAPNGEWVDLESAETVRKFPHFYVDGAYRRKPIAVRYRVAAFANGSLTVITSLEEEKRLLMAHKVRFITEWTEVVL